VTASDDREPAAGSGPLAADRSDRPLRFRSLEGLRAYLAWWVVLVHLSQVTGVPQRLPGFCSPLFNAGVAVNIFIILSGFVITHLLLSRRTDYRVFIARRAFRLWPAYLVGLAPMVLFPVAYKYTFTVLPWHAEHAHKAVEYRSVSDHFVSHLVLHLSMLHGAIPDQILAFSPSSLLTPAWSLSLEWQFYLVAPIVVGALLVSRRRRLGIAAFVVLVSIAVHLQPWWSWNFPSFLLVSGPYFLIGILTRFAIDPRDPVWPWPRARYQVLAVALSLVIIDGLTGETLGRELAVWFVFVRFALAESPQTGSVENGFVHRAGSIVATNRVVRHLGMISYSTYVLHIPVICLVIYGVGRGDRVISQPSMLALGLLTIPLIYIASLACYRLVEQPLNRVGHSIGAGPLRRGSS
jgi:peptidoglycan/LPS O-acetylase OafA/YrhL